MVATYAYVNPIIAVLLGWLIVNESFTPQMLFGAGIIVSSVVLITSNDDNEKNAEEKIEIHESNMPKGNRKTLSASA